ncbi:MAG: lipopolysaccharide biosynthesis protein [Ignavibacteriaceae bacterium]
MKLKHKIIGGVVWNSIGLLIDNGLDMIVKLILARLLLPKDFGIIGFAVVFMGMIKVFSDMGMSAALIQRKEEDLQPIDYDTAFWVGIAWGLFLAAIITFVVTPISISFFNEPLLNPIIPVLSINFILKPLTTVHIVNITREMEFKKIVLPQNISRIAAATIAVIMALTGFGVWSLVFQRVLTNIFLVLIYTYISPWRPKMRYSHASFKKIFSFGVYTTGTKIFNYLTGNVDYLLIGKMLGAQPLGVYTLAYNVTYVVRGQIMDVINKVFYPVYSKIQDDLVTIKKYYFKVIKYNCIATYPIMMGLILLAKPFVEIGLGEKWIEAIIPIKLMAGAGMVHLLTISNTTLLRGIGRPKLEMIMSIIKTMCVTVPFIVLGVIYNGINGAAAGLLASKTVIFFINNITLRKVAGIKFVEILGNAGSLFALTVTTVIIYAFLNDYVIISVLFVIYLSIHFIISFQDIKQIVLLYKSKTRK